VTRWWSSALVLACALALAGCLGTDEPESTRVGGPVLTVYASLPEHGVSASAAAAVAAGAREALAAAGGEVAGKRVRLIELDATEPGDRLWSPDRVDANAERAADDPTAIAYLGELAYGASAVSLPITNAAGLLQVSPSDSLTSLTQTPPGRPRAGPERYYPTHVRSFVRLTPSDLLLVEILLARVRAAGAREIAIVFDPDISGRELAAELVARARRDGPEPLLTEELESRGENLADVVGALVEARPDAVVHAGVRGPTTRPLLAALDRQLPGVPVYGGAGLLAGPQAPLATGPDRVEALTPVPPRSRMPADGRRVLRAIARSAGPELARPEALYGYEAMQLVLDAIRAGGPDRRAVVDAALTVRTRDGVIGSYMVRADGAVDTDRFAAYALRDGRFAFEGMVP
jgi:branched-chain amino acid transport system substrate-binding protein